MPKVTSNLQKRIFLLAFIFVLCASSSFISILIVERAQQKNFNKKIADLNAEIVELKNENDILKMGQDFCESTINNLNAVVKQQEREINVLIFQRYYIDSWSEVKEFIEFKQSIDYYINDLCKIYTNVDPYIVRAIVYHESRYNPDATNPTSTCVGLTQLSTKWFSERALNLGVENLSEPYGNLLTCVWYLNELLKTNSLEDSLYIYNHSYSYVNTIISTADELRNGGG